MVNVKINTITKQFIWELIPIRKMDNGVRLANDTEKAETLKQIHDRSIEIQEPDFINNHFIEYTKKNSYRYLFRFSRFGSFISAIDNRIFSGKLLSRDLLFLLGKRQRITIENCLQCETHNEMIRAYLKR